MEWEKVILEYLKVFLSVQVVTATAALVMVKVFKDDLKALMLRIAKIRLPGGGELSTPQLEKQIVEKAIDGAGLPKPEPADEKLPATMREDEIKVVRDLLNSERARAHYWEYRYLNYYLVFNTQRVLDWLASLQNPPSVLLFDSLWLPAIPDAVERQAILNALANHHLVNIENELITVTPKGHEYMQLRGPLPQPAA